MILFALNLQCHQLGLFEQKVNKNVGWQLGFALCPVVQSMMPPLHVIVGPHRLLVHRPACMAPLVALDPGLLDIVHEVLQAGSAGSVLQLLEHLGDLFIWKTY